MDFKEAFKGKKITVMGAGLLGGIGDIRFLAEADADLIVTDIQSEVALKKSIDALREFENVQFHLGGHDLADFRDRDLIIQAPTTPKNSPYIAEARKNKIPITMWAALFARFAKEYDATIVGVTGTRGKTTTTELIAHILRHAKKEVIEGGNIQGIAMLPQLNRLSKNSFVVLEIDSWKLQGFREEKISPHVAVFTTFYPDHLNYYNGDMNAYLEDKASIFLNQNKEHDILIVGSQAKPLLEEKYAWHLPKRTIVADPKNLPADWKPIIIGEHNKANIICAVEATREMGIHEASIKEAVETFRGVAGRLEKIRVWNDIEIFNDTTATTPEATIAALRAIRKEKKSSIVLIMGGADKTLDMSSLVEELSHGIKKVVLLSGSGTDIIAPLVREKFPDVTIHTELAPAVAEAAASATAGDTILFSPAFASFGMFKNEYDRGEQFTNLIQKL